MANKNTLKTKARKYKKELLRKYDERNLVPACAYCGSIMFDQVTIDHIIPLSMGGLSDRENLLLCCRDCNFRKRDRIWSPKYKGVLYER